MPSLWQRENTKQTCMLLWAISHPQPLAQPSRHAASLPSHLLTHVAPTQGGSFPWKFNVTFFEFTRKDVKMENIYIFKVQLNFWHHCVRMVSCLLSSSSHFHFPESHFVFLSSSLFLFFLYASFFSLLIIFFFCFPLSFLSFLLFSFSFAFPVSSLPPSLLPSLSLLLPTPPLIGTPQGL